ncbi:DUF1772 domain-containing protein [Flammeovirgaceae bacterium SG7u.111]|nr:DUF1772 domain-containing protein [Flammeovirgaceae bacterium SG7u.132]WPO33126.1 DUF1772 domain-containing protein [Flammeovirgaceae bacterium SG7u.111]
MGISIKSITLFSAVLFTGLSAGLFYAWAVSVIPGTKKVIDMTYLETMQSINRAILNPAFFLSFFGSLLLLTISSIQQYQTGLTFWIMLAATLTYLVGTFGVTAFGNIPLNNTLDALALNKLNINQLTEFRTNYEVKWNKLHMIRTAFSILSFSLSLIAVFSHSKNL